MAGNIFRNYAVAFTSPTAWIGILLILGLIFFWTKKIKAAKWTLSLGTLLFVLFAYDPFTEILVDNFESRYPGFTVESLRPTDKIKYIVVLAGGYVPDPSSHPLTTRLTSHTLARTIEGIKIHREIPGSIIIFTGKGWAKQTEASAMREMALNLGVSPEEIMVEEESTNTFDHTVYLKKILKEEPFILVTSAIHMPRAMGLFLKAGYKPIPAPTVHILTGEYEIFNMKVPFTTGDNLQAIDLWFNEFSAIVLAKLRGRI